MLDYVKHVIAGVVPETKMYDGGCHEASIPRLKMQQKHRFPRKLAN